MARLPRLTLAGYPHHVIQRGNNRQAIFLSKADYEFALDLLEEGARKFEVAVHSYVLMSNHLHLLATPASADSLPQLMQSIGRTYVRYFNHRQGRTGTLWEGRYKSTLVQAERYLLACMVYIDLNPVRARIVAEPIEYPWSSYAHNVGAAQIKLITPHPLYWELGNTPFAREAAYRELVEHGIGLDKERALTDATLRGWALGDSDYIAGLQGKTPRRVLPGKAGRPQKTVGPVPNLKEIGQV